MTKNTESRATSLGADVIAISGRNHLGFTLVELAIVIVLIGLIVSAVIAGQTLVKQANLRSAITKMISYIVAANSFKLSYNYFPGDVPNADAYGWDVNLNGNGDGKIDHHSNGGANNTTGEHQ
jgi:prepilin-type N-terminal cleavage/methylation domain-containing protein